LPAVRIRVLGRVGVLAQPERTAVAACPVLVDRAGPRMPGRAGHFFERGTDRLGDQFDLGQLPFQGRLVRWPWALKPAVPSPSGTLTADLVLPNASRPGAREDIGVPDGQAAPSTPFNGPVCAVGVRADAVQGE
jgi:hypothetical protein